MQAQNEFGSGEFTVVGVTPGTAEDVTRVAAAERMNYPVFADAPKTTRAFGVRLIWGSTFYLVDPSNKIVARGLDDAEAHLRAR